MKLRPLRDGDKIALVAASSPFSRERFDRAEALMTEHGFRLSYDEGAFLRAGYLAGTEAERARSLLDAFTDPEVAAVFCIRGGYGSSRLLPWLPYASLSRFPKILLGYSDVTFLHLAFRSRMGWTTFHGPNFVEIAEAPDGTERLLQSLSGRTPFSWSFDPAQVLCHGVGRGVLVGGNLRCLSHALATPFLPDLEGAMLMVEDCNEALFRLDRIFTQLALAGVLARLTGLVLGNFENCGEPELIREMVAERVRDYDFPVVTGLPFGHGCANEVLPLGTIYTLNTYEGRLEALDDPFGT